MKSRCGFGLCCCVPATATMELTYWFATCSAASNLTSLEAVLASKSAFFCRAAKQALSLIVRRGNHTSDASLEFQLEYPRICTLPCLHCMRVYWLRHIQLSFRRCVAYDAQVLEGLLPKLLRFEYDKVQKACCVPAFEDKSLISCIRPTYSPPGWCCTS